MAVKIVQQVLELKPLLFPDVIIDFASHEDFDRTTARNDFTMEASRMMYRAELQAANEGEAHRPVAPIYIYSRGSGLYR